ncbi:hypothetical protein IH879_10640 [candidate division KSB1 bacterium]|nr:hypothetical protein [candidate division KSB1 bacterium]
MSEVISFEFYSDTNQSNAYDELSMMALDIERDGTVLIVSRTDMDAMGDSIEAIMKYNGGELVD